MPNSLLEQIEAHIPEGEKRSPYIRRLLTTPHYVDHPEPEGAEPAHVDQPGAVEPETEGDA
jgi:hypothetical protein